MVSGYEIPHALVLAFQYSLCRVVLMVESKPAGVGTVNRFQYSLCRVVLMVAFPSSPRLQSGGFSTRSVESF